MAAASALRGLKQRDATNKRPRVTSAGEQQPPPPARKAEDDLTAEIAAVTAKNAQLQQSVASLKRKFSLREEETHQLLLGIGALNAVAAELAALQREHQARAAQNAALIQESLAQISSCSAQVDALKQCRGLTAQQLQSFRRECAQQMNRLVARLAELADSAGHEPLQDDELDENRRQVQRLEQDVCAYSARVVADDAESCKGLADASMTTERINVALAQLDELHAEMFQLKQSVGQEHQSFRRHLEDLVAQQMTQIREVQDNETERIHEEMDEIRSGMCGILKDLHRLKERTKYLVPSMAGVGSRTSRSNANGPPPLQAMNYGDQKEERRPTAIHHSAGYSITMATRQCQDELPHYEHGYDDDCYCPGVLPSQTEDRFVRADRPRSPSRSSNSSAPHSEDENWRMISPPPTGQRAAPPCESPHYSSRSSSLSGRLSVYGGTRSPACVPSRPVRPEQRTPGLLAMFGGAVAVY
ncbi:hypothetical protein PHYSODRAFT_299565 [Phytophthora sojae]|uniref:Uncharacterized protein n=1 Tax=Phytophthora sojae (strain P6497) TaxID=1094619 RepID=G4ZCB3_PHYSP|nr:hypothetical protein PHYSODRAFT_299565 [Phytophthora sojae]EGZ22141.1 hypothetical protein PHYSODRAFT_299565 [Phytophthora sojae]|eukprot:XP_009524858.1 hypothetical protein PHYSODRAFT_299565 [Phytophthora sojae]